MKADRMSKKILLAVFLTVPVHVTRPGVELTLTMIERALSELRTDIILDIEQSVVDSIP